MVKPLGRISRRLVLEHLQRLVERDMPAGWRPGFDGVELLEAVQLARLGGVLSVAKVESCTSLPPGPLT